MSGKKLAPRRFVVNISLIKPAILETKVHPPTFTVEKKFDWERVLSVTYLEEISFSNSKATEFKQYLKPVG